MDSARRGEHISGAICQQRIICRRERAFQSWHHFGVFWPICVQNRWEISFSSLLYYLVLPKNEPNVFLDTLDIKQLRPPGAFGGGFVWWFAHCETPWLLVQGVITPGFQFQGVKIWEIRFILVIAIFNGVCGSGTPKTTQIFACGAFYSTYTAV